MSGCGAGSYPGAMHKRVIIMCVVECVRLNNKISANGLLVISALLCHCVDGGCRDAETNC